VHQWRPLLNVGLQELQFVCLLAGGPTEGEASQVALAKQVQLCGRRGLWLGGGLYQAGPRLRLPRRGLAVLLRGACRSAPEQGDCSWRCGSRGCNQGVKKGWSGAPGVFRRGGSTRLGIF